MDCLCIAAEADPTGYVLVNGRTPTTTDLARLTGEPEAVVQSALEELERNGVFSRDRSGRIYNRRMVRDIKRIANNQKNGKMGGNPTLRKETEIFGSDNPPDKGSDKAKKLDARIQEPREDSPQPPSGGLSPSKAGGEASDPDSKIPAQMAQVWHEECGQVLRVPTKLNPARQKACKARWHDSFGKDLDQWRSHCRAIRRSPFLCGETENGTRNWRADFDWALTPRAVLGVAEGKYSTSPPPVAPSAQPKLRLVSDEDAEWERIENRANEIGVEFSRLVRGKQWTRDIAEARLKELQTLGLHLWRIKEVICLADDEVCETADGLCLTSLWRAA